MTNGATQARVLQLVENPPVSGLRATFIPLLILGATAVAVVPIRGQQPARGVTAADYARAELFLAPAVTGLVVGGSVAANWMSDDRFWYRTLLADGSTQTILVDAARKTRTVCTPAIADCPSPSARDTAAATQGRGGRGAGLDSQGRAGTSSDGKPLTISPDGTRGAFVRSWNLWLRDMSTGQEKAPTTDGAAYFGYATDNAGWSSSDRAILLWSHDSKKIATQQQDERNVGEMYLVDTSVGHPTLRVSKFPLPGDPVMAMLHRVVIDVDSGRITRLQMTPDFHRATLGDDLNMNDYNWSPDGARPRRACCGRPTADGRGRSRPRRLPPARPPASFRSRFATRGTG